MKAKWYKNLRTILKSSEKDAESTFWYPSMKLFRQKERHNWQEVMERVANTLKEEIKEKI